MNNYWEEIDMQDEEAMSDGGMYWAMCGPGIVQQGLYLISFNHHTNLEMLSVWPPFCKGEN